MHRFFALTLCLCLALTTHADLRLTGSDLLVSAFENPLELFAETTGQTFDIEMIGSQPGIASLERGEADITIAAMLNGAPDQPGNLVYRPFAFKVAFIAVNPGNPISELTLQQLAGIFGSSSERYYTRWGELGLPGQMTNSTIEPLLLQSPRSVLLELFKHHTLNGAPFKQDIQRLSSVTELEEQLLSDLQVIAVTDTPPPDEVGKIISVSTGRPGEFAFDPKPENVYYGDYPLSLPFFVVYPKANESALIDFLMLIYSDDFQLGVEARGFQTLPTNIRRRILMDFNRP